VRAIIDHDVQPELQHQQVCKPAKRDSTPQRDPIRWGLNALRDRFHVGHICNMTLLDFLEYHLAKLPAKQWSDVDIYLSNASVVHLPWTSL
jgi:hypothetical protein